MRQPCKSQTRCLGLLLFLHTLSISHALLQSTCPTLPVAILNLRGSKSEFWDGARPSALSNACVPATPGHDKFGHSFHVTDGGGLTRLLRRRARSLAPEPVLTLFYKRGCKWSAELLRAWGEVAAHMPVCSVAVEARRVRTLPAALGVHGIPAAVVYWPGRTDSKYAGDRSVSHLMTWVVNATKRPPRRDPVVQRAGVLLEVGDESGDTDWTLIMASLVTVLAAVKALVQRICVKQQLQGDQGTQRVAHRGHDRARLHEDAEVLAAEE